VAEGRERAKREMDQSGVRRNMQHLVSVASKFKNEKPSCQSEARKKERRRKAKRVIDAVLKRLGAVGWLPA